MGGYALDYSASSGVMGNWRRNLIAMWLSQFLVNIGFFGAFPFIPLFLRDQFGIIDAAQRGFYMSRFYFFGTLAYALFTPLWGILGDRFGIKMMLYRGSFITAFLYPLMAFAPNVETLIALRFLTGALSGTTITSQMLIVKTTPNDRQGFALGVLGTAIWGGTMTGDVVGGLVVHYFGYTAAFMLCGLLFFISGLFVIAARDSEKFRRAATAARPGQFKKHIATFVPRQLRKLRGGFPPGIPAMLAIFLVCGFSMRICYPYTTLMVERTGGVERAAYWTGIISGFTAGCSTVSGVFFGYLADRVQEWKLTTPAQLASSLLLLLCALSTTLFGFGFCYALNGFAVGGLYSMFQKVTASLVPATKRGAALGWATTMFNGGFMLSTLVSGAVVRVCGLDGVYCTAAGLMAATAVASGLMIRNIRRGAVAA